MTDKEKGPAQGSGEPAGEEVLPGAEMPGEEDFPEREEDELLRVKSQLAYLAAEFDNYRKRVAREKEAIVAFGNERILQAILPFLDNLERAMSQSSADETATALLSGVQITYDQMIAELRKFGVEQIAAIGEPFDPTLHEAIAKVSWEEKPEGTVLAESRKGYLLNGRLLRPAQVTVAQGAAEGEPPGPEGDEVSGDFGRGSADGEA
jgi:molecular chaperone GrpE